MAGGSGRLFQKSIHRLHSLFRFPLNLIPVLFVVSLLTLHQSFKLSIAGHLFARSTEDSSTCVPTAADHALTPIPAAFPADLAEYTHLHRRIRACLQVDNCTEDAPALIWSCPLEGRYGGYCGGIGDRLRNIRKSLRLAIVLKRALFIYWPATNISLFPIDVSLQPAMIDWRIPQRIQDRIDDIPFLDFHREKQLLELVPRRRDRILSADDPAREISYFNLSADDLPQLLRPQEVLLTLRPPGQEVTDRVVQNPYLRQNLVKPNDTRSARTNYQRQLTHMLFQPSPALMRMVKSFNMSKPYIGMHIRSGEDFNETEHQRFANMLAEKTMVVNKLLNCTRTHAADLQNVFLASDSTSYKIEFSSLARREGLMMRTMESKAVHLARLSYSSLGSRQEECDANLNVFADFVLLANSDGIITTGSGFAIEAFFFGRPDTVIISPRSERPCFVRYFINNS